MFPPRRLAGDDPEYTALAKEARLQGVVIVETTIDEVGRVTDVAVLKGLPMGLSEAAKAAVRTWRFEPGRRGDQVVAVRYILSISFRLDDEPPTP